MKTIMAIIALVYMSFSLFVHETKNPLTKDAVKLLGRIDDKLTDEAFDKLERMRSIDIPIYEIRKNEQGVKEIVRIEHKKTPTPPPPPIPLKTQQEPPVASKKVVMVPDLPKSVPLTKYTPRSKPTPKPKVKPEPAPEPEEVPVVAPEPDPNPAPILRRSKYPTTLELERIFFETHKGDAEYLKDLDGR